MNTFSKGGVNARCEKCKEHHKSSAGSGRCLHEFSNEWVIFKFKNIDAVIAGQKEKMNDLSIKNSRLWQNEEIRRQHNLLMQRRKDEDNWQVRDACEKARKAGTVVFPAIEIENEIEDLEDTTCIDTNRDELLKSFCNFRMKL